MRIEAASRLPLRRPLREIPGCPLLEPSVITPSNKCGRRCAFLHEPQAFFRAHHADGSGQAVGVDSASRDDSHGDGLRKGLTLAGIDDVRVAHSVRFDMLLAVARSRNGGVAQFQDSGERTGRRCGRFNTDPPSSFPRRRISNSNVPRDCDERPSNAVRPKSFERFIGGKTLGDPAEIELHAGPDQLDRLVTWVENNFAESGDALRLFENRLIGQPLIAPGVAPNANDGSQSDIELTLRLLGQPLCRRDHPKQVITYRRRPFSGAGAKPHELAAGPVIGKFPVQFPDAPERGLKTAVRLLAVPGVERNPHKRAHVGLGGLETAQIGFGRRSKNGQ